MTAVHKDGKININNMQQNKTTALLFHHLHQAGTDCEIPLALHRCLSLRTCRQHQGLMPKMVLSATEKKLKSECHDCFNH